MARLTFPPNPNQGDHHTGPNGIEYVWDGVTWRQVGGLPLDYVLKAGDFMTGDLHITNASGLAFLDIDAEQDAGVHLRARANEGSGGWGLFADATGQTGRLPGLHVAAFDENEVYTRSPMVFSWAGGEPDLIHVHQENPLSLSSGRLINVGDPQVPTDGANLRSVNNAIANAEYVRRAGDTMTGSLIFPGFNSGLIFAAQALLTYRSATGGPGTGGLTLVGDAVGQGVFVEGQGGQNRSLIMTHLTGVLKAGDTMTGALSMSGNAITNVLTPIATDPGTRAATKDYVDNRLVSPIHYRDQWRPQTNVPDLIAAMATNQNGDFWIAQTLNPSVPEIPPPGIPGISGQAIDNGDFILWSTPAASYSRIRGLGLTIGAADARYLQLTGGSMAGTIAFPANNQGLTWTNPNAFGAVYSDPGGNLILRRGLTQADLLTETSGGAQRVPLLTSTTGVVKAGDTMQGALTLFGPPLAPLHAATMAYADSKLTQAQGDARYLQLTGGTLSGGLSLGAVTQPDGRDVSRHLILWTGGTATTSIGVGVSPQQLNLVAANQTTNRIHFYAGLAATSIASVSSTGVHLNLAPTANDHATTKLYVDNLVATGDNLRVLKTGDTMTGALVIQGNDLVTRLNSNTTGRATLSFGHGANQHFHLFRNNGNTSLELDRISDTGVATRVWDVVRTTGVMNVDGAVVNNALVTHNTGIAFGSATSSGPIDLTRHIALWGGNTPTAGGFGFSITGGTLNYVVSAATNMHDFHCGAGNHVMRLNNTELAMQGNRDVRAHSFYCTTDNFGYSTQGNGWFYKRASNNALTLRMASGNIQPKIEDNAGGAIRDIIDATNIVPHLNTRVLRAGDTMTGELIVSTGGIRITAGNFRQRSTSNGVDGGQVHVWQDLAGRNTGEIRVSQNGQITGDNHQGSIELRVNTGAGIQRVAYTRYGAAPRLALDNDPVNGEDVATRRYVDTAVGGVTLSPWENHTASGSFTGTVRFRTRLMNDGTCQIECRMQYATSANIGQVVQLLSQALPLGKRPPYTWYGNVGVSRVSSANWGIIVIEIINTSGFMNAILIATNLPANPPPISSGDPISFNFTYPVV